MHDWKIQAFVGSLVLAVTVVSTAVMAESPGRGLADGIERAKKATVGILQDTPDDKAAALQNRFAIRGSGFHLRDGYILTARHAIERDERAQEPIPKDITILTTDLEELPATLTGVNAFLDIAVYRLTDSSAAARIPGVSFAKTEPLPGDEVFTVGYPLGWGPAVGFGRIGNVNVFLPTVESRLFQIDTSACSGNSGGGLFNQQGEIVGVVHAIIQTEKGQADPRCSRFAFSIPGPLVQRILPVLVQGGQPKFSRLGVSLKTAKMGTKWQVSVAEASGPALQGGIQKGDVLLAIEDTPITDGAQLKNYLIERTEPGQRVAIKVLRNNQEQTFSVVLGGTS